LVKKIVRENKKIIRMKLALLGLAAVAHANIEVEKGGTWGATECKGGMFLKYNGMSEKGVNVCLDFSFLLQKT